MVEKAQAQMLDFTNVKERGDFNPVQVEPGEYVMKIVSVVDQKSKNDNPMWVFGLQFVKPPVPSAARAIYPYHCVLDEKSLWKVRGLCLAAGFQVPKRKMSLDPNRIVGRQVGVVLEEEEYEGRVRSKIVQVLPVSDVMGQSDTDGSDVATDEDYDTPPDEQQVTDDDLAGVDL
jgi:hypothetical protein